jgi:hypothetical protein
MKQIASETEAKEKTSQDKKHKRTLNSIDAQLTQIIESLQSDIEKDVRGMGQWMGHVLGFVMYTIKNEDHLSVEKYGDNISLSDIEMLPGFSKLRAHCDKLGVTLELSERIDDIKSVQRDFPIVNFFVEISGWK